MRGVLRISAGSPARHPSALKRQRGPESLFGILPSPLFNGSVAFRRRLLRDAQPTAGLFRGLRNRQNVNGDGRTDELLLHRGLHSAPLHGGVNFSRSVHDDEFGVVYQPTWLPLSLTIRVRLT